ncbi:MAG TPA: nitroreductase family protein [Acidimicrobiales bacterium]|nr:nitroreductase family protein [Acidimicrobiales bacterium]
MDFAEVVRRRRMVRNFDPDRSIDPEERERILANALRAPSAGFSQGFDLLVLESAADLASFWREVSDPEDESEFTRGLKRAPLVVVPLANRDAYLDRYAESDKGWTDRDEAHWPVPYWHIDTGFAALLMLLTVVDEGLGACFFGIMPDLIPAFRAAFGVPGEFTPIGAVAIGYRAPDTPSPSLRRGHRPHDEVIHRGRF